jgi:hypothetical protein
VTATDIRVVFNRLSRDQIDLYTTGGDSDNDTSVVNSIVSQSDGARTSGRERYFYSMSDLAVGGRYGHV